MLAQGGVGVEEEDALLLEVLANLVVDDLAVVDDEPFSHEVVRTVDLDVPHRLDALGLDRRDACEAEVVGHVGAERRAVSTGVAVVVGASSEARGATRVAAVEALEVAREMQPEAVDEPVGVVRVRRGELEQP